MKEKFLPIGSVVRLKDATKNIMIIGYLSVDNENKNVVYDYSGCMYPEGLLGSDQTLLFFHNQIEEIVSLGYQDLEQKEFLSKLLEISQDLVKDEPIDTIESVES